MKIVPFELERYFAEHEFTAKYLLSSSDCEPLLMRDLLAMADLEAARLWTDLSLGYTEAQGHLLLREEISGIYDTIGVEDITVMAPGEGIYLLMHSLLEAGDHVVCLSPAYQSLHQVARSIGCQVTNWEPDEDQGWTFDVAKLEAAIRDNTKLVVINFPHNPTGHIPTLKTYEAIIQLVKNRGIYLLSDEMYRFLEVEPATTLPAACDLYERAISLFGLSKSFGLPGLRIGWLATRDKAVTEQVQLLKDYTTICNNAPSEILGVIALRNRESILSAQNERLLRNIGVLEKLFARFPNLFAWNKPQGGSVCFPRMLQTQDSCLFADKMVKETGIMLVPAAKFGFGDSHVRMGFGRENFPEVVALFAAYLEQQFV